MIQIFKDKPKDQGSIMYNNLNKEEIEEFIGEKVFRELESESAWLAGKRPPIFSITIKTENGEVKAFPGNWITK